MILTEIGCSYPGQKNISDIWCEGSFHRAEIQNPVFDITFHKPAQPVLFFKNQLALQLLILRFVGKTAFVYPGLVRTHARLNSIFHRRFVIGANVNSLGIARCVDAKMSDFLGSKHLRRKPVCFFKILALAKEGKQPTNFRFFADAHILHLYQKSRVLHNPADDRS